MYILNKVIHKKIYIKERKKSGILFLSIYYYSIILFLSIYDISIIKYLFIRINT